MGGKKERGEKNDEKLIEREREERRKYDREERRSLALPKAWTVGGGEKRRVHFPSFLVRERERARLAVCNRRSAEKDG